MDKTLEYVKMCRKAQEIQDAWEFERGDYFTTPMSAKNPHACCIVDAFWIDDQARNPRPETWVWLPLQHQLQDMVYGAHQDGVYTTLGLQLQFTAYMSANAKLSHSFEMYWLEFVMHAKFNKVWMGNEWVSA